MSLARAALLARQRTAVSLVSRRNASSSAHDNHHHEDSNEHYPKEEFSGPVWRNTVLAALAVVAVYKYAPEATEDTYLTRWIALYSTPREKLLEIAVKHTDLSANDCEINYLQSNASVPPVRRYRYPQSLDKGSPFMVPIGGTVDTSNVVVKGHNEF
ncbi:hypothetical protein H0H92_008896 [Tricholoma furcatifolium]|nr:hypothetical protein H0H92_008896 [Tricholoma furcatifolium]